MATRKDKDEPQAAAAQGEEPQVELQAAGPVVPVFSNDGVGQEDEKVNPAQEELQRTVDEAEAKGYYGIETDSTPDRHYSLEGVTSGLPTPETDRGNA